MQENPTPQFTPDKSDLTNLSLRDQVFKYVRYLPLFVVSIAISLMAANVYLRYTVPVYSSTGSVLIKDEKSAGGRAGDKVEELFVSNVAANIQSEMEILKSRPLMQRVVEELGLSIEYYGVGKIKSVNVYKTAPFRVVPISINDSAKSFAVDVIQKSASSFQVDGLKNLVSYNDTFNLTQGVFRLEQNGSAAIGNLYRFSWRHPASVASEYAGLIKVAPKAVGTGLINISLQTSHPQLCADVINELIKQYGFYSVEQKKQSNNQILSFVNARIDEIGRRLDSMQNLYLDYQVRNNIVNGDAQLALYFSNVVESDKTTNEQKIRLSVTGMIDEYLADKKNEFSKVVVPSTLGLEDPTLNALVAAYNTAQLERRALVDGNVPLANESVKQVEGQLEKIRLSIRENLRNIRSVTQSMIGEAGLRGSMNQSQLNAMPQKLKDLAPPDGLEPPTR